MSAADKTVSFFCCFRASATYCLIYAAKKKKMAVCDGKIGAGPILQMPSLVYGHLGRLIIHK
jgi:hypothetical protein